MSEQDRLTIHFLRACIGEFERKAGASRHSAAARAFLDRLGRGEVPEPPAPAPKLRDPFVYVCTGCRWQGGRGEIVDGAYCPQCRRLGIGNPVRTVPLAEVKPT